MICPFCEASLHRTEKLKAVKRGEQTFYYDVYVCPFGHDEFKDWDNPLIEVNGEYRPFLLPEEERERQEKAGQMRLIDL